MPDSKKPDSRPDSEPDPKANLMAALLNLGVAVANEGHSRAPLKMPAGFRPRPPKDPK